MRIKKALQQTFIFLVLGMEPRALHRVGKLCHWATPKSDFFKINVYIFFFLWKMRPKRLFYTTSTLVFVVWIFLFVWPVGSPLAFADWLKHCIPANWPFMFKTKQKNLPQPWTQCSLLISRQCLWLKITSAFEVCHSWHHKKSSGSSFTVCIMHYNIQIFKN